MGKLFKLALEEAVVEEPSIVEDVPVEEAVANAEELAKTDSEIQQDIAAVEELVEEKTKLEEQAMTNDELLSNPDAVVTATDVEVSEETRTEVQYALGYTSSMGKIRLSQESIANDVKSNPRKYLAISNEDIKDTIKKIWEKIKAFFRKIWDKVTQLINKLGIFQKLEKQKIDKLKQEADELANNPTTKNIKVKFGELKSNQNISTEARFKKWYIELIYVRCPYLLLAFGDNQELVRVLDPSSYVDFLASVRSGYIEILKRIESGTIDSAKGFGVIDRMEEEMFKSSPFVNAHRNNVVYKAVMNALDVENMNSIIKPIGLFSVNKNTAKCLVANGNNEDVGELEIKHLDFLPIDAHGNKNDAYLETIYNREFDAVTVGNMLSILDKSGAKWRRFENEASQFKALMQKNRRDCC